jgi:hypothetical protein
VMGQPGSLLRPGALKRADGRSVADAQRLA